MYSGKILLPKDFINMVVISGNFEILSQNLCKKAKIMIFLDKNIPYDDSETVKFLQK